MAKKKYKRTNNDLQNKHIKLKTLDETKGVFKGNKLKDRQYVKEK
jgi:hypothetical protein